MEEEGRGREGEGEKREGRRERRECIMHKGGNNISSSRASLLLVKTEKLIKEENKAQISGRASCFFSSTKTIIHTLINSLSL